MTPVPTNISPDGVGFHHGSDFIHLWISSAHGRFHCASAPRLSLRICALAACPFPTKKAFLGKNVAECVKREPEGVISECAIASLPHQSNSFCKTIRQLPLRSGEAFKKSEHRKKSIYAVNFARYAHFLQKRKEGTADTLFLI